MDEYFDATFDVEEKLGQFLDSFRTPFWLDEDPWFVQCNDHRYGWRKHRILAYCLYTLPYITRRFHVAPSSKLRSTCPDDHLSASYGRVRHLNYALGLLSTRQVFVLRIFVDSILLKTTCSLTSLDQIGYIQLWIR